MKKLTLALSAIAAAFSATASADVSVSGSSSATYISDAATSDNTSLVVGSNVAFAMSTTTAGGVGISASIAANLTPDTDVTAGSVSGGNSVTFTTGGATITVGDVELDDTPGSVGGAVGGIVGDNSALVSSVGGGMVDDDGTGLKFSTAVGASTLSLGYISNDSDNNNGIINQDGEDSVMSASIAMPMGPYTITVGMADSDTGESASGASVSAALGGGTLVVGYSTQETITANTKITTAGDTQVLGATYAMSLDADTSVKIGYQSQKDADSDSTTRVDASISRSLGGGASVYLDMRSLSGDATTDGTAIGFGTSVSF
tara:strand:+ start:479 stop:1429 length:951 start_codon:yes stop_codon:yes gene_type:complete